MDKQQLLELISKREQESGEDGFLDDLVHSEFSRIASRVNNSGVEGQIDWLIDVGLTIEQIRDAVKAET